MTAVQHLRRSTTSDQVAREVRRRIWHGEITAGARLNQNEIAASLGVSRIPVREALIALAHEGAVEMTPHRGAFVAPLTRTGVADHYELFGHIDGFALDRAMQRAAPEDLAVLAEAMEGVSAVAPASAGGAAALQRAVVDVRSRLHEMGGSARFHAVARGLIGLVPGNFFEEVPGADAVTRRNLPAVGAAIVAADAPTAVDHYRTMMREHGTLVLDILASRNLLTP